MRDSEFYDACRYGKLGDVMLGLMSGDFDSDKRTYGLKQAITGEQIEAIKAIVKKGDLDYARGNCEILIQAMKSGNIEVFDAVMAYFKKGELPGYIDIGLKTGMIYVMNTPNADKFIAHVLKDERIDWSFSGNLPLKHAIDTHKESIVKLLLKDKKVIATLIKDGDADLLPEPLQKIFLVKGKKNDNK